MVTTIVKSNEMVMSPPASGAGPGVATVDAAVIGAGPYGLSVAAHLQAKGVETCVFGEPMEFWAKKMPEGMLLRSPRIASNLSDPQRKFTLEAYESASNTPAEKPLPLDTFVAYGQWFRKQLNVQGDARSVLRIDRDRSGFRLTLQDGDELRARYVVIAAGIGPFRRKPAVYENVPAEKVIHCYEGRDVRKYVGKRVVVIGAGQSALESSALMHEAKAEVEIIARQPQVRWIGQHAWLHNLGPISSMLYAWPDVGPAGISRLVAYPNLMTYVPRPLRDKIRKRAVRPAGSAWLPERLKDVKIRTGLSITKAQMVGGELALSLDDGSERRVDYVMLGTGYQVDISRYNFLAPELVQEIEQDNGYPKLARGFQTSVPGLHFVGATAALAFGPLLNFVAGADFACRELTGHLNRKAVWASSDGAEAVR